MEKGARPLDTVTLLLNSEFEPQCQLDLAHRSCRGYFCARYGVVKNISRRPYIVRVVKSIEHLTPKLQPGSFTKVEGLMNPDVPKVGAWASDDVSP